MQTVLECKQCGGQLDIVEGKKIAYCKYCGSANAFSIADRFSLYNRANYLRQKNEFERAIGVYEGILNEDSQDAESYFGIALCKYGIEYVEDTNTEKRIPTCHRTRIKMFTQDDDYLKALKYSDPETQEVYKKEAAQIDHIIKRIQELSSNQKKYDIFICYKESDENGDRTKTSVIAQDIYDQLNSKGYKVFFARKTLEGMIGSDYEPIIFSALYSAKVMLVIGTRAEEFQATWVKNEWIRYFERISGGEECTMIPCYKDISPYDLPNEMSNIQSLDMSKIGFVQDLFDALSRLLGKNTHKADVSAMPAGNAEGLKKRAFLFLEEGEFAQATQYLEKSLDINPEDAECYWGKILVGLKCKREEDLEKLCVSITGYQAYQFALRFATPEQAQKYKHYADIMDNNVLEEQKRKEEEEKRKEEERKIQEELAAKKKQEELEKKATASYKKNETAVKVLEILMAFFGGIAVNAIIAFSIFAFVEFDYIRDFGDFMGVFFAYFGIALVVFSPIIIMGAVEAAKRVKLKKANITVDIGYGIRCMKLAFFAIGAILTPIILPVATIYDIRLGEWVLVILNIIFCIIIAALLTIPKKKVVKIISVFLVIVFIGLIAASITIGIMMDFGMLPFSFRTIENMFIK